MVEDAFSARGSMDRASDYGSEGWGFESLRARRRRSGPGHMVWARSSFTSTRRRLPASTAVTDSAGHGDRHSSGPHGGGRPPQQAPATADSPEKGRGQWQSLAAAISPCSAAVRPWSSTAARPRIASRIQRLWGTASSRAAGKHAPRRPESRRQRRPGKLRGHHCDIQDTSRQQLTRCTRCAKCGRRPREKRNMT